ncbi:GMC family oxidoreductase N-terminal domain-containing protein [Vibrio algarum]|uniref:GMC family oxidoreductase N-terminal domain-containing protein n=1 Tax=Vibrio algarum TaxID=3020714 RepID=A0ABT4YLJ8_9VIBR|nr:GMC family oxidoreductase N-terminal domain-containing protein [Vibrio sp. KJ40-1]MDB1122426.1 GMC family oxidoreductase N-terminal domain-containing protein [Vibrio sp. KJ40-1]
MLQKYKHGGVSVALGKSTVTYVEGECAGGGSEINSGLYHRIPEEIIENWVEQYGVASLSSEELEPYYQENEKAISVSYMPKEHIPLASLKLYEGAQKLGWDAREIPRWYKYDESGSGTKQSMTETLIPESKLFGATYKYNNTVKKIQKRGNKWIVTALEESPDYSEEHDYIAESVFICAGAIATPMLLQSNRLAKNAGKQFYMHPTVKMVAEFPDQVNSENMGVPVHQVKEFSPKISLGCSISSKEYIKLAMLDIPNGQSLAEQKWKNMAVYYAMTASGKGSITKLPFFSNPLVRFDLGGEGYSNILKGIEFMGKCLFSAGANHVYPVVQGGMKISSFSELKDFLYGITPEQLNLMTIHLFSSCPMGEKDVCVTNSYGKVNGQEGLYVNDASLLCTSLGVNPQGAVMAIARRNIEQYLKERLNESSN